MRHPLPRALAAAVSLILAACSVRPPVQRSPDSPRLIVLIVVDQMRADFVDRLRPYVTGGFKRLLDEGAVFVNAAYPYLGTYTCSGHATIATGTLPMTHGLIDNTWFDRANGSIVACTEDDGVRPVPYAGDGSEIGHSARWLEAPTLGDVLEETDGPRVVSVALKARSAIMLAGPKGDAVAWLSDDLTGWETSTAFANGPIPEVADFLDANPIDADAGRTWSRLRSDAAYEGPDDGAGELPVRLWTRTFPHVLANKPGRAFRSHWERSPFADAYVGRFAAALASSYGLGAGESVDLLAVGFSSPDLVGHMFGPRSHEVQDILLRLDLTLGQLFAHLDGLVGRGRYLVALSSDHGVSDIPEQRVANGQLGVRLPPEAIETVAETAARATAGDGRYVWLVNGNDIHFQPGMFEKLRDTPRALQAVLSALSDMPEIRAAFHEEQLSAVPADADELLRETSLSFVRGRSGQIVLQMEPGAWVIPTTRVATTHGTGNEYDQRVPIILMGPGVKPGSYEQPASPADIAPTLAALVGVTLPNPDGRVLGEAIDLLAPAPVGEAR